MPASDERPRGRPRDGDVDAKVLAATLELIGRHGLTGWTLDSVASDAEVSKPAIYRRWDSKRALVVAAVSSLADHEPVVMVGEVRTDLISLLRAFDGPAAAIHDRLALRIRSSPGDDEVLLQMLVDRHLGGRRAAVAQLLHDAIARGELAEGLDVDVAVETLLAASFVRPMGPEPGRFTAPLSDDRAGRLVDLVLDGMRAGKQRPDG